MTRAIAVILFAGVIGAQVGLPRYTRVSTSSKPLKTLPMSASATSTGMAIWISHWPRVDTRR
jgi:hypothetical protein